MVAVSISYIDLLASLDLVPKIGPISMGHFFLKKWYLHESTFRIPWQHILQKPKLSTSTSGVVGPILKVSLTIYHCANNSSILALFIPTTVVQIIANWFKSLVLTLSYDIIIMSYPVQLKGLSVIVNSKLHFFQNP